MFAHDLLSRRLSEKTSHIFIYIPFPLSLALYGIRERALSTLLELSRYRGDYSAVPDVYFNDRGQLVLFSGPSTQGQVRELEISLQTHSSSKK